MYSLVMNINKSVQKKNATEFVSYWADKGYEKGECQPFWMSLLRDVLGVEKPEQIISFEDRVKLDNTAFIDGIIPRNHVLIEQKSRGKDLNKPIRQSDGTLLTPFQQAKRYSAEMPYSQRPRWIITSNFTEFYIYDMEQPNGEPEIIKLEDLPKEAYRLNFIVDTENEDLKREMEISIAAGELVGVLYDALLKQYKNPNDEKSLRSLNILCTRIVFLLYAEDADILGTHMMFHDYLARYNSEDLREALISLFRVLDTKIESRDPYLKPALAQFPYVNGGLFADENIEIPIITDEIRDIILSKASEDFDWSDISPTIFGAVFESTLNPQTRRAGGMHYTSIENIHKVIDPLFLDDLKEELAEIKIIPVERTREKRLAEFQNKLASMVFLDPACGSGNFLTETYISLRRMENEVLSELSRGQISFGEIYNPIKVSINQFYGIEINDFAATVAKTALWIAESQMLKETESIVHMSLDFLPLKTNVNIIEGNSLQMDWHDIVSSDKTPLIIGNPAFVGARLMSPEQKQDVLDVFGKNWKNAGNLDYVTCWFKKAADMMKQNDNIRAAFVSTNSITQGEQVAALWKPLCEENGIHIDFAYRTFRWDSESNNKAHVNCVIIGFSRNESLRPKFIFSSDRAKRVFNINPYLIEADNVFIESRNKPICDVPEIGCGNIPLDGGNYIFTKDEMDDFIKKEPKSKVYFHSYYGADEFINNRPRYCLYLGDCTPLELRQLPECMKRVDAVQAFRLQSKRTATYKAADTPSKFQVINRPEGVFIVLPSVSSERRKYMPIGFMSNAICSNAVLLMPNADIYSFGILTSNVHMAWMRTVCGRMKSDYRYSKDVVYNNFPWPDPTPQQKAKIEQTAQQILDVRAKYPDCSLADLYDDLVMPSDLREAHRANDRAVMQAYGFPIKMTESECVAALMQMYEKLTI